MEPNLLLSGQVRSPTLAENYEQRHAVSTSKDVVHKLILKYNHLKNCSSTISLTCEEDLKKFYQSVRSYDHFYVQAITARLKENMYSK